jgi:hypothetical protein
MQILRIHIAIGLFTFSLITKGQDLIGYYKNSDNIQALGFVTRLHLKIDSTFEYSFVGDLFNDKVQGSFSKTGKVIKLSYLTPNFHPDTIYQKKVLNTTPPITVTIKTINEPFNWQDPIAFIRPTELKLRHNKLIVIRTMDSSKKSKGRKMKLKKIPIDKWNNSGATTIGIIPSNENK